MSAVEQLLAQYREKTNIKKSRKRPRDSTIAETSYIPNRSTKNCTEKTETSPSETKIHIRIEN